jgi:hypothetical protein
MTKTISEAQGTIGGKKTGKSIKKSLEKDIKQALVAASNLLKASSVTGNQKINVLCLDLKRKIEALEKEYGVSLL